MTDRGPAGRLTGPEGNDVTDNRCGGVMKYAAVLLAVVVLGATADTLDYQRYVVVVNATGGGPVGNGEADELKARALDMLGAAVYDRDISVATFLAGHPKNRDRLERMTMSSRKSETRFLSDGATTVSHEFSMLGGVMEQLLPVTGGGRLLGRVACPCCGQEWPEGREVPSDLQLVPFETGDAPAYTGILFDGRGLEYEPALFPRVVTQADDEVYGPGFADEERLAAKGMVGYYQDQIEAVTSERVGPNPLVVRAVDVAGNNGCDLVVSDYDAARIHGSATNLELLAECRVGLMVE